MLFTQSDGDYVKIACRFEQLRDLILWPVWALNRQWAIKLQNSLMICLPVFLLIVCYVHKNRSALHCICEETFCYITNYWSHHWMSITLILPWSGSVSGQWTSYQSRPHYEYATWWYTVHWDQQPAEHQGLWTAATVTPESRCSTHGQRSCSMQHMVCWPVASVLCVQCEICVCVCVCSSSIVCIKILKVPPLELWCDYSYHKHNWVTHCYTIRYW